MNPSRQRNFILIVLLFSVTLAGCSSVMERVIPPPTSTSTPSPTPTLSPTFTVLATLTFTPPPPVEPTATVTFFPTATYTVGPVGTPTNTTVPTDYVGLVRPVPSARFRGNFPGGKIVFSSNAEADRVAGLHITFKCWGDNYELNLARASMKISNSSFTYGSEGVYVQGTFTSSTTAKGVFDYTLEKNGKKCSYSYQGWTADMR